MSQSARRVLNTLSGLRALCHGATFVRHVYERSHHMARKVTARTVGAVSAQRAPATEEIRKLIAETAYYRAQQRGFTPGYDVDDWLAAEMQVMQRLPAR
jgi:Protein of unknown function (DUF2934)